MAAVSDQMCAQEKIPEMRFEARVATHIAGPGTHQHHPQLPSPPPRDSTARASHQTTHRGAPRAADRGHA